ncbi:hypothetical protein OPT61_g3358 [Boeremia exigua]|uniref:Uncharacterized protein n=1 Tax=Boeremia exigua TaxID=749465 RepID=A0ACC2II86_9PLEO|nr:hypothetical protein OPT61_g3358 [Boeremia exigua]
MTKGLKDQMAECLFFINAEAQLFRSRRQRQALGQTKAAKPKLVNRFSSSGHGSGGCFHATGFSGTPQSANMLGRLATKFPFRAYKGDQRTATDDLPAERSTKRRDQIRRAQKTYRQRKDEYVKSLEAEVAHLRVNEAKVLQKVEELRAEVEALKAALYTDRNLASFPNNDVQVYSDPLLGQSQSPNYSSREMEIRMGASQVVVQDVLDQSSHLTISSAGEPSTPSSSRSTKCLGDFDPTLLGSDLEGPCLPHVGVRPSFLDQSSNGHALTLTSGLLSLRPSVPSPHIEPVEVWRVPSSGLDRLLDLSRQIVLDHDEITPVQAWAVVQDHNLFSTMSIEHLEDLKLRLLPRVKCHGFGGVISRSDLTDTIARTFVARES